jgi:hypothetical protein
MIGDRDEDELCAADAVVNFIRADLFRSYFGDEYIEKPQQRTKMMERFNDLLWEDTSWFSFVL